MTLYWQATARPQRDYHTFTHIYDGAGRVVAQSDGPTGGGYPPTWWITGQVVTETHTIAIPSSAPADLESAFFVGLYDLDTGARLPVVGSDSSPSSDSVHIPVR